MRVFQNLVKQRYLIRVKTHSFDNTTSQQPIPLAERFTIPALPGLSHDSHMIVT